MLLYVSSTSSKVNMAEMTKIITEIRKAVKENVGVDISRDDVQNLVSVLRNVDMIKTDEKAQKKNKTKVSKNKAKTVKGKSTTDVANSKSVASETAKSTVESFDSCDAKLVDNKKQSPKSHTSLLTKMIEKLPTTFDGQERYLLQCFSLVLKIDLYLLRYSKQDMHTENYQEILDSFEVFLVSLHKGLVHENKHWKPIKSEHE